ncbi:MAG TPA: hypothetical protein VFB84_15090 [Micromonosporaceae bacterium]|nr:hypothetical protein [Micromonosporaceae bacterium]
MTWPEAAAGIAAITLLGMIVAVVIWQAGTLWRARMMVAREEAYRSLAEQATQVQQRTVQQLEQVRAELSGLRERSDEMRRVLTEVEQPWVR